LTWRTLWLAWLVVLMGGCSLVEPHREIYGRWRAQQLSLAGIAIPVAPNMDFSAHQVTLDDKPIEVDSYSKQEKRITVHLKSSISLTFEMEGSDAMTIELPLVGRIRYTRTN
jgi:hypothetical protein